MAEKFRKLTPRGQTVKGALATLLVPRLAADGALKPGELHGIIQDMKPAPYAEQRVALAKTVKEAFGKRLAQDADLDDLEEILEALEEEGGEFEDAPDPGAELMAILGKLEIPAEELEKINSLITALAGKPAADEDPDLDPDDAMGAGDGEDPAGKGKGAPVDVKKAMDAAMPRIEKNLASKISARFQAAEEVKPFVGRVDAMAADSAEAVYKLALDAAKVDLTGVHPSAYRTLVSMLPKPADADRTLVTVADAKDLKSFAERYPNAPALV